ncbi:MAG TPA: hypothetical protein VN735_14715 [Steroidobacteraceae bacterium]|nr:hypothetical protein [Steroidobacteraceae bacterium]
MYINGHAAATCSGLSRNAFDQARFAEALAEQRRPADGVAGCRATTMPDRDNSYFQRLGARELVGQRSPAYTRLSESEQAYTGMSRNILILQHIACWHGCCTGFGHA